MFPVDPTSFVHHSIHNPAVFKSIWFTMVRPSRLPTPQSTPGRTAQWPIWPFHSPLPHISPVQQLPSFESLTDAGTRKAESLHAAATRQAARPRRHTFSRATQCRPPPPGRPAPAARAFGRRPLGEIPQEPACSSCLLSAAKSESPR
jgi:hypothetical protein